MMQSFAETTPWTMPDLYWCGALLLQLTPAESTFGWLVCEQDTLFEPIPRKLKFQDACSLGILLGIKKLRTKL